MSRQTQDFYEFGDFRVDSVERVLLRAGELVPLTPKVFDLLLLLVENNGHVVEKARLMKEIWPNTFVEEGNLTQNISLLRKVLSDGRHHYIQTIPRRGYRFVGHVGTVDESEFIIEEHSLARVIVVEGQPAPWAEGQSPIAVSPATASVAIGKANRLTSWRLRPLSLVALLALIAILTAIAYFSSFNRPRDNTAAATPNVPRSIAVLPFQNLTTDTSDEFLGLGVTDALISKLSEIRELKIRPTSAVRKYSGPGQNAATAGRELDVDSVLEGSVQRDGDQIRVSVQLIDVKEGRTLWAQAFDERFTNIFAVEDAISEAVARAMTRSLTTDERTRLTKHYTDNPEAHELYLQGRFYLNKFTEDGTKLARKYFEQAIARDPHYALAYSGLAESYAFGEIGLPPQDAFPKAREAAVKALDLDESLGEAHAVLAQVGFLWDWDWAAGEVQFKRALELNPGDPEIHHMYAHYLSAMGRFPEALAESQRLLELDPLSPASRNHMGWHYFRAHEFDQAIEQYKLVLAIDPNFAEAHRQLAEAYAVKGRFDESVAEMNRRFVLIGRNDEVPVLEKAYSSFGWKGYWGKRLELLLQRSKHSFVSPSGLAFTYVQLSENSHALDWLERAYREHDHDLVYLRVDPEWDRLRAELRFQELLRRMRLADEVAHQ